MKNRKGFTIVELVIVIAVIAILAAVLIPTFSGVVKKANDSAALQTARSTLTNALNMSSTAQLSGQTSNKDYTTMIVIDGHAYGYTGNELEAIDYPIVSKEFVTTAAEGSNSFNSILIAAENITYGTNQSAAGGNPADGTVCDIINVKSIIQANSSENKVGCTTLTLGDHCVTYVKGHYYLNYVEDDTTTANVDEETWDAEIFVNGDFSNKVVVFTTFG